MKMGFSSALQGRQSHEALLARQDAELRLLETMKRCLTQKAKSDKEYAMSLGTVVQQGLKIDRADDLQGSHITKAWRSYMEELEHTSKQIKINAELLETVCQDRLTQLYQDKRKARKQYQEEHSRISTQFSHLTEDVTRKKTEYQKHLEYYKLLRTRFEEHYIKSGRAGRKLDDVRDKYQKACRKLHLAHNEYVLLLSEAIEFEKDFRTILLPGLLEHQQSLQEEFILTWRTLLEDVAVCDNAADKYLEIQKRIEAAVQSINPAEEYREFIEKHKTSPASPVLFQFDETLIEDSLGKLQPNTLTIDNLTVDWLRTRLGELENNVKECQEKQTKLCLESSSTNANGSTPTTPTLNVINGGIAKDPNKNSKELNALRSQERQMLKLCDMIKSALNDVGCEELPSGCDDLTVEQSFIENNVCSDQPDDKMMSTIETISSNTTSLYILQKSADVMSLLRAPFRRKSAPPLTPKLNTRALHTHPDSVGSSAVNKMNNEYYEKQAYVVTDYDSDNNNNADDCCLNLKTNIYVDIETSTNSLTGLNMILNNSNGINNNNYNNIAEITKISNGAASVVTDTLAVGIEYQTNDGEEDDINILPTYGNDFNNSKNNLLQMDDCSSIKSSIDCHLDKIDKLNEKLDENLMALLQQHQEQQLRQTQIMSQTLSTESQKKNTFREKLKIKIKKNTNLEEKFKSKVFNMSCDDHMLSRSSGGAENNLHHSEDDNNRRQKKQKKKKKKRATYVQKSLESEEELLNNNDVNGHQISEKSTNTTTPSSSSSFSNQLLQTLKNYNLKNSSSNNISNSAEATATDIIFKKINDDIVKNNMVLFAAQAASNDEAKILNNIQFLFDETSISLAPMNPKLSNTITISSTDGCDNVDNDIQDNQLIGDQLTAFNESRQITDLDDSNQGSTPSYCSHLEVDTIIPATKVSNFGSKLKQNIKFKFKLPFKGHNKNSRITSLTTAANLNLCKRCLKRSRTQKNDQSNTGTPIHTSNSVFDFPKEFHLNVITEIDVKEFCICNYEEENEMKDNFISIKNHNFEGYTSVNEGGLTLSTNRPLYEEEWFHGVLPREEVVRLLRDEGDFLVRETTRNDESQTVLSVCWNGHKHFIVQTTAEGHYRFEGPAFPSIQELILHQYQSELPVTGRSGAVLKKPVLRERWELSNDDVILLDKIGRGNFGDVYKAKLKSSKKEVAVKTCRMTLPDEQKRKFLQEGRILKQYDHPNIVKLIGICVQKQPIMIVMELVAGGSLLMFLRKNAAILTPKQLMGMCKDAAAGMRYLESKNCIHRDLAARNCLIGNENIVKISDFGMSREEEEYIVSDGMKQIPIKWTAPEALNFGKYTTLCDVWSYGILVWEVFSKGGTPYSGMTNSRARERIDAGYRMPAPENTPQEIYRLMLKCWSYEPESRPHFDEIFTVIDALNINC